MKKGILVSKRTAKDKTSGNDVLWLNIYELPREYKNKDGQTALFYPKSTDAVITCCVDSQKNPNSYLELSLVNEGTILAVHFAINDYTNKSYVSSVDVIPNTNHHSKEILYK